MMTDDWVGEGEESGEGPGDLSTVISGGGPSGE